MAQFNGTISPDGPATVASLGQARVDPERERAFASLVVRYERERRDWDRLVRPEAVLLGSDFPLEQSGT